LAGNNVCLAECWRGLPETDFDVPELRTDWLSGRSVLVAENRANRPNDFEPTRGEVAAATSLPHRDETSPSCPFCIGNESRTPASVYERRAPDGGWQVRVVPNIFPAVDPVDEQITPAIAMAPADSQIVAPGTGAHEVIIECPRHIDRLSALRPAELGMVLQAYAARLAHWSKRSNLRYGLAFKNQGHPAGASMAHLHSQLVALPFVPPKVEAEQKRAAEAFALEASCPYCRLIDKEIAAGDRVVFRRDGFIAFCPFASWQPCEVWVVPTSHRSSFEAASPNELQSLAGVLHILIRQLESLIPGVAYNLVVHTAPWTGEGDAWNHWRIELLPRLNAFAGLELATGVHVNPVAPERAAGQLRLR
jgi:UDPglucose--hexose-1-phosphate uridylyltransferase